MPVVKGPTAALRPYDFRRPYQLNKLQVEAIGLVSDGFCRAVSNLLTAYLHSAQAEVSFRGLDQVPYEEFLEATPVPSVLNVFSHPPESGTALMRFDVDMALVVVDKALGGPGLAQEASRPLTEIEQAVFGRFAQRLLALYAQSWASARAFSIRLEGTEFNPVFAQIVGQGDLVVVSRFEMALEEGVTGIFELVWPYATIRPLAQAVATHGWNREDEEKPSQPSSAMHAQVVETPVLLRVLLGRAQLSLEEFSQIAVGHVIVLDRRHDDALDVELGGLVKFQAVAGQWRGQRAVRMLGRQGAHRGPRGSQEDHAGEHVSEQVQVKEDGREQTGEQADG